MYEFGNGTIIDANVFCRIYDAIINDKYDLFRHIFEHAVDNGYILVDDGGKIKHEWRTTCCGDEDEFFNVWYSSRQFEDAIREGSLSSCNATKKYLKLLGVPSKDCVYLRLGINSTPKIIVSDDSDFFEPKAKTWSTEKKRNVKLKGGSVSTYMKKQHGVEICCPEALANCMGLEWVHE